MTSQTDKPIAVVTGAGSGIGRATALQLSSDGYDVRIFELSAEAAGETLSLIQKAGGTGAIQTLDVSNTDSVRAAFESLPRLDALVNNAGVAHIGNVLQTSTEDLDRLYQINVRGLPLLALRHSAHAQKWWRKHREPSLHRLEGWYSRPLRL
jgi:NAD(P)-dependent dehydrogenase (short-subunit alcohol dehydrogenase family)